jgi:hypothetical protein
VSTFYDVQGKDGMVALREAEERRRQEAKEAEQRIFQEQIAQQKLAEERIERANLTLQLVAQPGWPHFVAWLGELSEAAMTSIRAAKTMEDVRAFQAEANLIDNILSYPDIVQMEAKAASENIGSRA